MIYVRPEAALVPVLSYSSSLSTPCPDKLCRFGARTHTEQKPHSSRPGGQMRGRPSLFFLALNFVFIVVFIGAALASAATASAQNASPADPVTTASTAAPAAAPDSR